MKNTFRIDNAQLKTIRNNTDWRKLFDALGIKKDENRSRSNDWWGLSPFTQEKTASFHLSDKGFYCFSTNESGGVVELVQKIIGQELGKELNCYEAGAWLVDNGISFLSEDVKALPEGSRRSPREVPEKRSESGKDKGLQEAEKPKGNKPIKQDMIPLLSQMGTHKEFIRREISEETCKYLGCGYLKPAPTKSEALKKMQDRIIFQVRGIEKAKNGDLSPVILSHIGRAVEDEKISTEGKWRSYSAFQKTLELYNIDKLLLDERAMDQAKKTDQILILEGCFDVANLIEGGILNVVATFGSHLDEDQLKRIQFIQDELKIKNFLVWYDRDKNQAGQKAQEKAVILLNENGFAGKGFDWNIKFNSSSRGSVQLPCSFSDPGNFFSDQLQFLRKQKII